MRIVVHITLILCITLWPLITLGNVKLGGAAEKSLKKLDTLVTQYSDHLTKAIQLIKDNKDDKLGLPLGDAKKQLSKITSFLQTDGALKKIAVFDELVPQLTQLSDITKSMELLSGDRLVGMLDKLKSAFSILGVVQNKIVSSPSNSNDE